MIRLTDLLLLAIGLFASSPVAAEVYRARTVGDWAVGASKDGQGCFLSRQYDSVGGTTLLLGVDMDGTNHLSVLNDNCSIKPKERLKLDFRLSNGGYLGQLVFGMASDGKSGFVTTFEPKFPTYFGTSAKLYISRGDVPVERLSLTGSGAAVAELRRCVEAQRVGADAATGEAKRYGSIPRDPFARRGK
jgi:hypothetical protein